MKTPALQFLLTLFSFLIMMTSGQAQVTGRWKTVDDADGKEKAVVEIYERQGMIYGKVVRLSPGVKNPNCKNCPGELKDKPIVGMVIMKNLTKTENGAKGGQVMDPGNGNTYSCNLELVGPDKLKLRGFIGITAIGRTQYWYRESPAATALGTQ
jgi:uncharacterized protein (DUF2147 family)